MISSFRHPNFISGVQPTIDVPPPATVLGLISAVCGRIVTLEEVKFGYVFFYFGKGMDTELIYELTVKSKLKAKSNVIRREFLFRPELYIYVDRIDFRRFFRKPEFPVLLGRTQELAKVEEIGEVELFKKASVRLGHCVLPFGFGNIPGSVISSPLYFSYEPGRARIGMKVQPFIVVHKFVNCDKPIWYDEEKNWGVFIYGN
jgi:CRISPR-associated protein Cas5t